MTELNRAHVLVTGAGGGFGQQFIRQLLAANCRLLLTDLDGDSLKTIAARIFAEVGKGEIVDCLASDLSSAEGCDALCDAVAQRDICPDIIINNAGIALSGRLDVVPRDRWETLMEIDLLAPMRICARFMPAMVERGSGHIVNISSIAGWVGAEGLSAYNAAKFGLRGFGEGIEQDLQAFNIKVSTVYPWFSRTPILQSERYGTDNRGEVPDEWVTDPADVVAAILDAVSKDRHHVFPDRMARRIHLLKRYAPFVLRWMAPRVAREVR